MSSIKNKLALALLSGAALALAVPSAQAQVVIAKNWPVQGEIMAAPTPANLIPSLGAYVPSYAYYTQRLGIPLVGIGGLYDTICNESPIGASLLAYRAMYPSAPINIWASGNPTFMSVPPGVTSTATQSYAYFTFYCSGTVVLPPLAPAPGPTRK